MRFELSRQVGADGLILHHERHLWQPIRMLRNDARRGMWALRPGRRLQRGSGRPLTPFARGGVREPGARTVASGPEWPMRADGRGRAASRHPPGCIGRAGIRSSPTGVGGLLPASRRGQSREQLGGPLGSPFGIYTGGWGTARACPVPHAVRGPG